MTALNLLPAEVLRQRLAEVRQAKAAATTREQRLMVALGLRADEFAEPEAPTAPPPAPPSVEPDPPTGRAARCGTESGYKKHRVLGEPTCPACRRAHREASALRGARRRARRAAEREAHRRELADLAARYDARTAGYL